MVQRSNIQHRENNQYHIIMLYGVYAIKMLNHYVVHSTSEMNMIL